MLLGKSGISQAEELHRLQTKIQSLKLKIKSFETSDTQLLIEKNMQLENEISVCNEKIQVLKN